MSDNLTLVLQSWRKRRRNYRVLFGTPVRNVRLDWQRSLAAFRPGQVFAYERWDANKYGTQSWTIQILAAVYSDQIVTCIHGVKPGAKLLISKNGARACRQLIAVIDAFKKQDALRTVSIDQWSIIGHKLELGAGVKNAVSTVIKAP